MKRKNKKVVAESLPVSAEETIKNARAEMKGEDFSELRIQKSEATPIPQGKPAAAAPAPQNAQSPARGCKSRRICGDASRGRRSSTHNRTPRSGSA
ncbi:MAG: hypothetical protein L6V82_02540 [Clostridiales bacterium]|nr:MAG: hypothetical protein L6V82_02540 [Clostridiales bacterium]